MWYNSREEATARRTGKTDQYIAQFFPCQAFQSRLHPLQTEQKHNKPECELNENFPEHVPSSLSHVMGRRHEQLANPGRCWSEPGKWSAPNKRPEMIMNYQKLDC
jgi:hypothetical protein